MNISKYTCQELYWLSHDGDLKQCESPYSKTTVKTLTKDGSVHIVQILPVANQGEQSYNYLALVEFDL